MFQKPGVSELGIMRYGLEGMVQVGGTKMPAVWIESSCKGDITQRNSEQVSWGKKIAASKEPKQGSSN